MNDHNSQTHEPSNTDQTQAANAVTTLQDGLLYTLTLDDEFGVQYTDLRSAKERKEFIIVHGTSQPKPSWMSTTSQ